MHEYKPHSIVDHLFKLVEVLHHQVMFLSSVTKHNYRVHSIECFGVSWPALVLGSFKPQFTLFEGSRQNIIPIHMVMSYIVFSSICEENDFLRPKSKGGKYSKRECEDEGTGE